TRFRQWRPYSWGSAHGSVSFCRRCAPFLWLVAPCSFYILSVDMVAAWPRTRRPAQRRQATTPALERDKIKEREVKQDRGTLSESRPVFRPWPTQKVLSRPKPLSLAHRCQTLNSGLSFRERINPNTGFAHMIIGFIGVGVMGEPMCRNLATKSG